jgi:alkyl hydroperoxide reductase subunit AhpC
VSGEGYGVFNEENGAPIRGTFLIDRDGVVIWSLVKDTGARRTEMVPGGSGSSATRIAPR